MWAGPNTDPKTGGLALAQKGWAELGATYCFLFWGLAGPGPANWAGLKQVQPEAILSLAAQ
jgi:hypothetical protein